MKAWKSNSAISVTSRPPSRAARAASAERTAATMSDMLKYNTSAQRRLFVLRCHSVTITAAWYRFDLVHPE